MTKIWHPARVSAMLRWRMNTVASFIPTMVHFRCIYWSFLGGKLSSTVAYPIACSVRKSCISLIYRKHRRISDFMKVFVKRLFRPKCMNFPLRMWIAIAISIIFPPFLAFYISVTIELRSYKIWWMYLSGVTMINTPKDFMSDFFAKKIVVLWSPIKGLLLTLELRNLWRLVLYEIYYDFKCSEGVAMWEEVWISIENACWRQLSQENCHVPTSTTENNGYTGPFSQNKAISSKYERYSSSVPSLVCWYQREHHVRQHTRRPYLEKIENNFFLAPIFAVPYLSQYWSDLLRSFCVMFVIICTFLAYPGYRTDSEVLKSCLSKRSKIWSKEPGRAPPI